MEIWLAVMSMPSQVIHTNTTLWSRNLLSHHHQALLVFHRRHQHMHPVGNTQVKITEVLQWPQEPARDPSQDSYQVPSTHSPQETHKSPSTILHRKHTKTQQWLIRTTPPMHMDMKTDKINRWLMPMHKWTPDWHHLLQSLRCHDHPCTINKLLHHVTQVYTDSQPSISTRDCKDFNHLTQSNRMQLMTNMA